MNWWLPDGNRAKPLRCHRTIFSTWKQGDHDGLRLRLMQPVIVPAELSAQLGFCFGPSGRLFFPT